jgi:hypothetical protein
MARRKLPAEIAAKASPDLDVFARESTKLGAIAKAVQNVDAAARKLTKLAEVIAQPELPDPDEAVRKANEAFAQHLAENVYPYLIRPEPERESTKPNEAIAQSELPDTREPKRNKGGAPRKANYDQVRAFVRARTQPGQKASAFVRREVRQKFKIKERTLRRILAGQS